jgi:hypothetical protein
MRGYMENSCQTAGAIKKRKKKSMYMAFIHVYIKEKLIAWS